MRRLARSARKLLLAGLLSGVPALVPSAARAQQDAAFVPMPSAARAQQDATFVPMPAPVGAARPAPSAEIILPPTERIPLAGQPVPTPIDRPAAAMPAEQAPAAGEAKVPEECKEPKPFWSQVPQYEKFPLPGWFILAPNDAGYYSLEDCIRDECRKGPPKYPYPRFLVFPFSMFNVDWRYLDDPKNEEHDYFDFLKRIHIGDDFLFTTCGEFRFRYNNEVNSRLTGTDNTFDLERTRVYFDTWYQDKVRVFVEVIDARTQNQDLPPQVIDQDHIDFLNLFADVKLGEYDSAPIYLRVGRQELLYGSQRLISPLDFANTRRTFQGIKGFWHSENLDLDAFAVQPVIPNPTRWDSVDNNQIFSGLWATYRPKKNQLLDLYVLNLDNTNQTTQLGIIRAPINCTTFGARYAGDYDGRWLWEAEGDVQVGTIEGAPQPFGDRGLLTDASAVGFGYCFKCVPTKPQLWVYYEHASGDKNPNVGVDKTFQQLFPFGHYYFGGTDQIGRQNINDLNAQFVFYPTRWITCLAQYHVLRLDSQFDALYNSAGVAIRRDPTGKAGTDVGEVLNLVVNFHLDKHQDILIQNAHLYAGDFIKRTGTPASRRDLNALYIQYCYRW